MLLVAVAGIGQNSSVAEGRFKRLGDWLGIVPEVEPAPSIATPVSDGVASGGGAARARDQRVVDHPRPVATTVPCPRRAWHDVADAELRAELEVSRRRVLELREQLRAAAHGERAESGPGDAARDVASPRRRDVWQIVTPVR